MACSIESTLKPPSGAEEAAEKLVDSDEIGGKHPSGAKAPH
jgi:hypothetical protein